jgi:hypothetical protein
MDYFILPEDWVASPDCFSEKVLPVAKAAMPFLPPPIIDVQKQPSSGIVRVAIAASAMKLNTVLFDAIARIAKGAKAPCEFHFFTGAATGLPYFELSRTVRARIPHATVHPHTSYDGYVKQLANCDFFLSPFPHGGMTSIMDAFKFSMPGVCLDGREPHAHADAAIFARIGLPAELTANSVNEYVASAIRLIDDQAWRLHCTDIVRTADLDTAFFRGDASLFCKTIENMIWPSKKVQPKQKLRRGLIAKLRRSGRDG